MNERDRLVDDILAEIQSNRGVPYEKRNSRSHLGADSLVDEIIAESTYKTNSSVVPDITPKETQVESTEMKVEKPDKKGRQDQQEDLLATITPWEQRHAQRRGLSKTQPLPKLKNEADVSQMAGVKNTRDFFDSLKKNTQAPASPGDELLYKKSGAMHPKQADKPAQPVGQLKDVSTGEWKASLTQAAQQMEELYEPTRMVPGGVAQRVSAKTEVVSLQQVEMSKEITGQVRLEGFDLPQEEQPEAWENEFVSGRQDKIKQFKMDLSSEDTDLEEPDQEDGEYHGVADAPTLKFDLLARRRYITLRFWITLCLLLPVLMLTFVNSVDLTNGLLSDNPVLLLSLYGGLLIAAFLLNLCSLFGGFAALFRGGDRDTPAALAMVAALLQGVVMAVAMDSLPAGFSGSLLGGAALLALLMNLAGKRMMFTRMYRNLELIGNDREKSAVTKVEGRDESFELGRGLAVGMPQVAYDCKTVDLKRFMYHSYAPDRAELSAKTPMLLSLFFGLAGGLFGYFFLVNTGVAQAVVNTVSGLCGGVVAGLPITVLLSGNVPMSRVSRWLYGRKIMLSGYDAVEEFQETDVLALDAASLFPAGSIALKSIKSATNQSLDRSIMDVAGVVYMADSPLKPLFENILQGKTNLLPEVDTLVYEDEMGISGWVMGYRVLVGTKKLMENHGVQLPDTDYEDPYHAPGLRAVYLSTQGILSAVFLVQYTPDPDVAEALQRAVKAGLGLHIYSCDPNVTRELICKMFKLPSASVRVMSAVPRRIYKQQREQAGQIDAILSYEGNGGNLCRGVVAAMQLRKSLRLASILQSLFSLLGAAGFCLLLYLAGGVSGGLIWLYQIIAGGITLILPGLLGR